MDGSRIASGGMLGLPAKYFRTQDEAQIARIRFQTERYCQLAAKHLVEIRGQAQS